MDGLSALSAAVFWSLPVKVASDKPDDVSRQQDNQRKEREAQHAQHNVHRSSLSPSTVLCAPNGSAHRHTQSGNTFPLVPAPAAS
jgi:hypothetical protein